ncbi:MULTISPECIES: hypothetical protein [unclassified Tolypothrix]|uniref:hypothetical protein n=1 Tax=unclassified Tolypothrix TaxID=2649714 RepID=UPI0005EAB61D|nr:MULTISPECIES: hypothetical protein [unclassified Tolypothrix]EKF01657.1 hypothetical protein FDUTEX481_07814 [Tolypothrix sp. PCC 7601]MBE9086459.1 hypothetical protein [Tolypothrix sp. LEGE 11397]UYD34665.1 hypothetical protein HG267_02105 [Tolypothrix sp. PCC 7601]
MDFGFWIDPDHKGAGLEDFGFWILDLFHPQGVRHEPKKSKIGNLKSKIGTVKSQKSKERILIPPAF